MLYEVITGARTDGFNALAAYDVINLTAQWQVAPHMHLNARVDNLFNEDYMLVYGYNTPGRRLTLESMLLRSLMSCSADSTVRSLNTSPLRIGLSRVSYNFV